MPIFFEQNDISSREVRHAVEDLIRECIGDRPAEERWRLSIEGRSDHYHVTVKGPQPTRHQYFFGEADALPQKIRDWLESCPFR